MRAEYAAKLAARSRGRRADSAAAEEENIGRVLLVVRDDLAASQLRDIVVNGEEFVMDARFRWFVSQQTQDIRKSVANKNRIRVGAARFKGGGAEQLYQADQQLQEAMGAAQEQEELDLLPSASEKLDALGDDLIAQGLFL